MSVPAKPKYRSSNWKDYNTARTARGSLLFWLDKGMYWHGSASGEWGPPPEVQRGGNPVLLGVQGLVQRGPAPGDGMAQSLLKLAGLERPHWKFLAIEVTDNAIGDAPMLPCRLWCKPAARPE